MNEIIASKKSISGLPPPDQFFDWAFQAMREKNWIQAVQRWAVLREAYPKQSGPWIQGAVSLIEAGELDEADKLLKHARILFKDNPNVLIYTSEVAMRKEDWKLADVYLSEARDCYPENELVWIKSALCAELQNDFEKAASFNIEARKRFPGSLGPLVQYAELAMKKKQWEEALSGWQELRTLFPQHPAGYLRAAEAALELGLHEEARKLKGEIIALQQSLSRLPPPDQFFDWAFQAMREKNWLQAAQRWAVLGEFYPNQAGPWIQGASSFLQAGKLNEAEELLKKARKLFLDNPNALIFSSEVAIRKKEWELADAYLFEARKRFPENELVWTRSALCAELQDDLEKAKILYSEARKRFPDSPGPLVEYAELAMKKEQWEKALLRWQELRTFFPKHPAGYMRAAESALKLNLHKEARKLKLTYQYGLEVYGERYSSETVIESRSRSKCLGHFFELLWTKAVFNLKSEIDRNYFGYGWWFLEPLLHMAVYYIVFGVFLQSGGINYSVFLLSGLIPWMWFSKSINSCSGSIASGQHLMNQVGVPAIFFPLVILIQTSLKQLPVMLLLSGFLFLQGLTPNPLWWILAPVVFVQTLLTFACACLVAAIIPFIPDLNYLVPTGLTFLMFLSGIFYDYRAISTVWQEMFLFNPIAFLLKCYREILIDNITPDLQILTLWGFISIVICLLIVLVYNRLRYIYPRIVSE
ncbi:MAG: tetratricopeptide repeat protein [Methylococcales bacterium]